MPTSITGQGISIYPAPDDALSSTSKRPVQNKVIDEELSDVKNAIGQLDDVVNDPVHGLAQKAPLIVNTASGEIANFADGADDMPIKKVVGTIVPVQDLHGYDNPWPAGGGTNKWDEETELGTISTVTGEFEPSTEIIRTKNYIPVVAGNSYLFVTTDQMWVLFYDENKTLITEGLPSGAGTANNARNFRNGYSCVIPAGCAFIRWYFRKEYGTTYKHDTALNYPSTVTTYSPYENICPISGWTGANIVGSNRNFVKTSGFERYGSGQQEPTYDQATNSIVSVVGASYVGIAQSVNVKPNTDYVFSATIDNAAQTCSLTVMASNNTTTIAATESITVAGTYSISFNSGNNSLIYLRVYTCRNYKFQQNRTVIVSNIILSEGTTTEGVQQTILPINWQSSAGTIYGGTVTLNEDGSADVVPEYVKKIFDASSANLGTYPWATTTLGGVVYNRWHTPAFPSELQHKDYGRDTVPTDCYCNINIPASASRGDTAPYFTFFPTIESAGPNFCIPDSEAHDRAGLISYLTAHPIELAYPLATPPAPIHIQNVGELYTYLGTNNIWIDTGAITECDYPADTKLYIDNAIANALNA